MRRAAQFFITLYAYAVSPFLGQRCRFHPTCSAYAHQAVGRHGLRKGLWLAIRRFGRCHPWYQGDFIDPVP